ncbi:MAG TPA: GTP 3',8-cyclase MoaA [Gammaproteobacteria bacterium]|nr:GTP 3',8-cyclase MoaA [Gammaproteobacteria bacterium]
MATLVTQPRDLFSRPLKDLRVSVTDRCNFRCTYCMPKEIFGANHTFLDRKALLTFEEIARVSSIFIQCGVEKIRLTGGEPLLRRDIDVLVEMLAKLEGLKDLTLTTNGSVLTPERARMLKDAGLRRITVSLDALDDPTFKAMNDVGFTVSRVLEAIDNAAAAGLTPVKVNAVIRRGVNEHVILPMARHFKGTGHIVRFIEYMDVGNTNGWRLDHVVPAAEIMHTINAELPIEPSSPNYKGEVAKRWRFQDGSGEIGIISSVTQPFCATCTRARLSAEGKLYTCLFASTGHDLRRLLRSDASDEYILGTLQSVWGRRSDRYSEIRTSRTVDLPKVEMSYIGG